MAGAVDIRLAGAADIVGLIDIDSVVPRDPARADAIVRWVEAGICFVANVDGKLAGYGVLHYHFFERGLLEMLMVGPAFRGQGIGRALVLHAIRHCHTRQLWTSTNQSNSAMLGLIASLPFIASGHIHGLDQGDPELFFRLERP